MRVPRSAPQLLAAALAGLVVLAAVDVPLVDDTLFWWAPKGLMVAERGPSFIVAGGLPAAAGPDLPIPPQWADGLPDYAHPPLWYWWLGAFLWLLGPTHTAVHLAVLPVAMAWGAVLASLAERLGGRRAAWCAGAAILLPPVVSQLTRADTDVPLLLLTTWALLALVDRREGAFAALAVLATWCKEPGVLLAVPAVLACAVDGRLRWGWAAPLLALGAWAATHHALTGWALAGTERLPEGVGSWLRDVATVAWITLGDQGRLLPWLVAVPALRRATVPGPRRLAGWLAAPNRRPRLIAGGHVLTWVLFFGTLNFLGGIDRADRHTHVRYLLPGMTAGTCLALAAAPWAGPPLVALSAWSLTRVSPHGPESTLLAQQAALALRDAAPLLDALPGRVWVGTYDVVLLTRPYAGLGVQPARELATYRWGTQPGELAVGDHVVVGPVGEPLGRLQELAYEEVAALRRGPATVRVLRVVGRDAAPPPR